jgi:hypothetical protein
MQKLTITFLLLAVVVVLSFSWLSYTQTGKRAMAYYGPKIKTNYKAPSTELLKLQSKALSAEHYVKEKGFNTSFCFLIDMSLPANHKRFFVYDFDKDTVLNSGLVTHGNCNQYWLEGRKYGNEVGCGCTSLGRYKIGNSYYGRFGLAFKLHGLDSSNNNAFRRFVVLHSHSCVPNTEVQQDICQSNGCPTVSPEFLNYLEPIIKAAKKPVLMWIFE